MFRRSEVIRRAMRRPTTGITERFQSVIKSFGRPLRMV
jgi:hypothetical protein